MVCIVTCTCQSYFCAITVRTKTSSNITRMFSLSVFQQNLISKKPCVNDSKLSKNHILSIHLRIKSHGKRYTQASIQADACSISVLWQRKSLSLFPAPDCSLCAAHCAIISPSSQRLYIIIISDPCPLTRSEE